MKDDRPNHKSRYGGKGTYPLTAAMTDTSKPATAHVEKGDPTAKPEATISHAEKGTNHNDRASSTDGTVVGDDVHRGSSEKANKSDNTNARLSNPLKDLTDDEVMNNAEAFAKEHNLPVEVFRKAAMVAKRPMRFEQMSGLSEEDKAAFREERDHPLKQTFTLWWLVIACSLAAAVQGMDESVISGAQLFYPTQFGINSKVTGQSRDAWLEGLVNGAPYLCSAVIACWLTDPLNRWLGRRWTIGVTAFFAFITCIWSAVTNTWWHLFIARFFLGFGIGPKSATVPVYAAECAPAKVRGRMVMMWQTWTAFGIMIGYVADLAFYHVPDKPHITGLRWRLMLGSAGFPAVLVMIQLFFLPESPRWLMSKGRYTEAYASMQKLRRADILAARDIYYTFVLLEEEAAIVRGRNRFIEIFTVPRNRRAMYASTIVMFGQQFCGVNAIVYYTASIFTSAGFSDISALLASWGFGMLNWLFAIPGILTIDKYGRRPLLLVTFPLMSILLLFVGFCFWIPGTTARTGLVTLGIYLYCMVYSPGEGPVPFTYSAEAYPLYIRELGMGFATAILWGFNFIVGLTFPALLNAFKPQGAFGWYAGWNAVLFLLVLFFLPETKGFTLEELDYVFSVDTKEHAAYQAYNAKWHFNKYVLRKKEERRELYQFDDSDMTEEDREMEEMARAGGGGG